MSSPQNAVSRKTVTLPDELWDRIAQYRHFHQIPTETEAVRRLLQNGLQSDPTIKAIAQIVTKKSKYFPGIFSSAYNSDGRRNVVAVIERLVLEISRRNKAMTPEQANTRANEIWNDAHNVGDTDSAVSFLNLAWEALI